VVVVDSRQPAAALMVLNAMANGRPVITSEGGAVFDLIKDGVDGLIVPRENSDALAERILMLIQNPAERLRMAVAGYRKVEEMYSPSDMAESMLAVYASMLAGEPLPKSLENRPRKAARQGA
jgi:glycosyltransferase involved in cell wall biosynthesis